MDSEASEEPAETDDGPDPQVVAISDLAEMYSCSPMDVMAWPFEAMLDLMEFLNERRKALAKAGRTQAGVRVDRGGVTLPGLSVTDARGHGG